MTSIGRLLQPYVTVIWGGENLSFQDDGEGGKMIFAHNVEVSYSNDSAPEISFDIIPSPPGVAKFMELKMEAIEEPIVVTIGYPNGSSWEQTFFYSGFNMTSGHNPSLSVTGVSALKGPYTDNRVSYTMEEKMKLSDLPEFLQGKVKPGADSLKFIWTPPAKKIADKVMYQENQLKKTPYSILQSALRPHGIRIDPGGTAFDQTLSFSIAPTNEGEPEEYKTKDGENKKPTTGERNYYIVGPGLATSIQRTQKFNIGQNETKQGTSKKNDTSHEQDQEKAQASPSGSPQYTKDPPSLNLEGTAGRANPEDTAESRTPEATTEKAQDRRAKATEILTTTASFNCPMLPNFMGMKPRDFIAIPSLKGPGDYIEDWEIDTVSYSLQEAGGVEISISCKRPYTGDETILDSKTIEEIRKKVKKLITPALWAQFYWRQGPADDLILSR